MRNRINAPALIITHHSGFCSDFSLTAPVFVTFLFSHRISGHNAGKHDAAVTGLGEAHDMFDNLADLAADQSSRIVLRMLDAMGAN